MKTTAIFILILGLANCATAQYEHTSVNNISIYTTESENGGKMTIDLINNKSNLTIDYQLIDPFNKAVLVIFDISGRVIVQQEIYHEIDQVLIPSENWPAGHYTVSLFADKKTVMTKKITLSK